MLNSDFSFSKNERIKSKKEISRIFKDGIFFYSENINVKIIKSKDNKQILHKIGISVPKRLFKLAVDRNKLKRRIREAYRLNKQILYTSIDNECKKYNLFFIYRSNKISSFKDIAYDIIKLLTEVDEYLKSKKN